MNSAHKLSQDSVFRFDEQDKALKQVPVQHYTLSDAQLNQITSHFVGFTEQYQQQAAENELNVNR